MAKVYPNIAYKKDMRKRWNNTIKCELCGTQAEYRVDIEINWFRGDDVRVKSCSECLVNVIELCEVAINKENKRKVYMNLKKEFDVIKTAIASDEDYAWGWHCNLAMPYMDEGATHEQANKAAARAMLNIFGVDTSKNKFSNYQPKAHE